MIGRRYLDHRGFMALLRACSERNRVTSKRDYFLIYFLGRTGLRISEFLALTPRSFSLDSDPPFVRVVSLKRRGRRGIDPVLLEDRVVRLTRTYINKTMPGLSLRTGAKLPVLMPASSGRPMTARNASYLFQQYARRARLREGITLHSLRHYRTTTLMQTTGDLEFVRQQIRHRNLSTTQQYLHVDPTLERKYLQRLDALAGQAFK